MNLPRDILLEICKYLFPWDAQNVGRTCRRYHSIMTEMAYLSHAQYTIENNIFYGVGEYRQSKTVLYCGLHHGLNVISNIKEHRQVSRQTFRYNKVHGLSYSAGSGYSYVPYHKGVVHGTQVDIFMDQDFVLYQYSTFIWDRNINVDKFIPRINYEPNRVTNDITYWNPEASVYVNRKRDTFSRCIIETIALSDGFQMITYLKRGKVNVLTFKLTTFQRTMLHPEHIRTEQFDGRGDLRLLIDYSDKAAISYRRWHPRNRNGASYRDRPKIAERSRRPEDDSNPGVQKMGLPVRWRGQFCLRGGNYYRAGIWHQYNRAGILISKIDYGIAGWLYNKIYERNSW